MSVTRSSPVPGWWSRTWPLVALGLLSVTMWTGRIRNVLEADSISAPGRVFRLVMAVAFIVMGALLLWACWVGKRNQNWRKAAQHTNSGWRVGVGVPEWGQRLSVGLIGLTVTVWLIQGIGILIDPSHNASFKAIHTFLMVGSVIVAGNAWLGLRRTWPVSTPSSAVMPS